MKLKRIRKRVMALTLTGVLVLSGLSGTTIFAAEADVAVQGGWYSVSGNNAGERDDISGQNNTGVESGGGSENTSAENVQETVSGNLPQGNAAQSGYSEDFSGVKEGEAPAGFTLSNLGSAEISVVENNGNQVLYLNQSEDNSGSKGNPTVMISLPVEMEKAVLSYSVAAETGKGVLYLPTLYQDSARMGEVTFNQNGGMKLAYKNAKNQNTWGQGIEALKWYTIKQVYEKGVGLTLYINGEKIADSLYCKPELTEANRIGISLYRSSTGAFYLDNLKVTAEDHEPVIPAELTAQGAEGEDEDITYLQDFESVSAGDFPSGWSASNQESSTKIGVEEADGNRVLVIRHPSYQNASLTLRYPLGKEAAKGVLKYRVKTETTSGALYLPTFYSDTYQLVKLAMNGGKFQKAAGSGWADIMDFEAGKWYEVEIVLDTEKGVYDLYIDGEQVLAKEPQANLDTGKINRLAMGVYKQTTNTYSIDDIRITPYVAAEGAFFEQTEYTVGKGKTLPLRLVFTPEDTSDRTAVWTSSDEETVTVDKLGRVTGVKEGTAQITAAPSAEGLQPVTVTVHVNNVQPEEITVSPEKLSVPEGSYAFITPTVEPDEAVNKAVRFESENPEIAQVDSYGEVFAKSSGKTSIWVISEENEEVKTEVPVTITDRSVMKQIYVSTSGDDAGDGSQENPVKTFERARELVRESNGNMTGDIEVIFAEGYYHQASGISMDEKDSGTNGYFVRYIYEGEKEAVIGSERRLEGWAVYDAEKNIYAAEAAGIETRQLFVNGVRAVRARSEGGLNNGAQLKEGNAFVGFTSDNTEFLSYKHPEDLEFVFKQNWTNPRCQVSQVSQQQGKVKIVMDQPGWTYCADKGMTSATVPVYYENALELLDEPGEWYLDTHEGKIYYMPRSWENMETADITVPVLEKLLTIEGSDYDNMVRNISFEGLTFADTTWNRPSTNMGHADSQNNHIREHGKPDRLPEAAVTVRRANTVLFTNCNFTRLGITALKMVEGVQNSTVKGCRFYDISGSAINVGDPYTNNPDNYNPSDWRKMMKNNDILNNYIHDIAVDYMSAAAISVGFADYMDMMYNEIFDIPYSAFHIGYGWAKRFENVQKNMHIEYNFVHDLMGDGIFDGGAFYFNGNSGGTENNYNILANNYVRNQMDLNAPLYTDEGTTYWRFENNVVDLSESPKWHGNADPRWMLVYVPTIEHIHVKNIYTSTANKSINKEAPDVTFENIQVVENGSWPQEALQIMENAGLQAEYASLRKNHAERVNAHAEGVSGEESPEQVIAIGIGEEASWKITATDGKDRPVSLKDAQVYYTSSNPQTASVDENGMITGAVLGTARITASIVSNGILKEISTKVYVGDEFSEIRLEDAPDGEIHLAVDAKGITLNPKGYSDLGREVVLEQTVWSVEDSTVAEVDENGFLKPLKPGKTQLTADASGEGKTVTERFVLIVEAEAQFVPDDMEEVFDDANQAAWSMNGGALEVAQGTSVKAEALTGFAYYTGKKYKNELLTFDLTIDANGKGGWPSIMLRSQDAGHYVSGGASGYIICMGSQGLELHRFNDSKRTVIYGNMNGYESLGGDKIAPSPITHGEKHKIEVGALTEGNGVRLLLKVDDKVVFDFLDESEDAITESGYFGLVGRGETFTIGKRIVEVPVDTQALSALVEEAGKLIQSDYTPESWTEFAEALKQAQEALRNPESQAQVDEAEAKLQEKMDALKKADSGEGNEGGDSDSGDGDSGEGGQEGGENGGGNGSEGGNHGDENQSGGGDDAQGGNDDSGNQNPSGGADDGSQSSENQGNTPQTGNAVKTGDEGAGLFLAFGTFIVAAAVLAAAVFVKRRRKGSE